AVTISTESGLAVALSIVAPYSTHVDSYTPIGCFNRHIAREAELSGHDEVGDGDAFEAQFVDADVVEQHEAIFPAEVELATIEAMVTPAWQEYHRVHLAPQDIDPPSRIPFAH